VVEVQQTATSLGVVMIVAEGTLVEEFEYLAFEIETDIVVVVEDSVVESGAVGVKFATEVIPKMTAAVVAMLVLLLNTGLVENFDPQRTEGMPRVLALTAAAQRTECDFVQYCSSEVSTQCSPPRSQLVEVEEKMMANILRFHLHPPHFHLLLHRYTRLVSD